MALGSLWAQAKSRPTFLRRFSTYLLYGATWIPVMIWFNTNVAELTMIEGSSMYPFLNNNINEPLRRDLCLNVKLYAQADLARGMIVTFRSPFKPDTIQVKRVVGLEGDVVHTRRPYPNTFIRVPPGHIWVEGDIQRTDKSLDSNTYGPISTRLVTGRISHVLLPWRKAGRVKWWEHEDRVGIVRRLPLGEDAQLNNAGDDDSEV